VETGGADAEQREAAEDQHHHLGAGGGAHRGDQVVRAPYPWAGSARGGAGRTVLEVEVDARAVQPVESARDGSGSRDRVFAERVS
jgi:hypothetical protein